MPDQPTDTPAPEDAAPKKRAAKKTTPDAATRSKAGMWTAAGIGVGIGSAAIAAALIYANRAKDKKDGGKSEES